jgi:hypothetical protein
LNEHEKQILDDFARHQGWPILNRLHIEQRESKLEGIAHKLFTAEPTDTIDQLEIVYWRGFFRGQRYLLNNPKLEAKKLASERTFQGDDAA